MFPERHYFMCMGLAKFTTALGRRDGLVLWALAHMKNPTNRQLARATGYSVRTVQRAIKSLVETGFVLRSARGRKRRMAPVPGMVTRRLFIIPKEDLEYLFRLHGQEKVSETIRVLEFTYATSRVKPRCPIAILKAVLKRGRLVYPKGYIPRSALNTTQETIRAFDALPLKEKEARIQRAYAKMFARTGDHASSLARAEAVAITDFGNELDPAPSPSL